MPFLLYDMEITQLCYGSKNCGIKYGNANGNGRCKKPRYGLEIVQCKLTFLKTQPFMGFRSTQVKYLKLRRNIFKMHGFRIQNCVCYQWRI